MEVDLNDLSSIKGIKCFAVIYGIREYQVFPGVFGYWEDGKEWLFSINKNTHILVNFPNFKLAFTDLKEAQVYCEFFNGR